MAPQSFYGLKFAYRLCGQPPTVARFVFQDTETLTIGDLGNLESGYIDLAATGGDDGLCGAILQTKAGTTLVTEIECIIDWDAVYAAYDANARLAGATLDITGTTGAQLVGTSGDADLRVVSNSAADELTYVMINKTHHFLF